MLDFTQRVSRFSLSVVVAASLAFAPVAGANTAFAAESDDLTAQADELAASSVAKQAEADTLAQKIDGLQTNLNDAQQRYNTAMQQHDEAQGAADDARQRKEAADDRTAQLQERLGGRAVDMYKSGGSMSFLGVLMGVSSFDDFVNMWDTLQRIAQQDANLIDESKQVRTEAAEAQASFEEQSQIAADEMTAAQAAKDEIEATKSTMETELAKVTEEVALLQGQEESVRLSAEEAKQREEEAARVAASYSASAGINDYSGGGSYSDSGNSYTGGGGGASAIGGWVNPCPSYYGVTCEFGYSPITGSHNGIDLGAASGAPILAAGPGTVTYVGWYGTGGNAVIVSHGNGMRTIYMHQSQTAATVGQAVNAGDVIGYVGTTGLSTGPHLHFQIEINGSPVNPRNYYSF